ncbi:hypothetical protein D3C86_1539800 [compost metagenome]
MLELHVREFLGHLQHRLLIAERGAEDQLVALAGQVAEHALGVSGGLGHVLDERGLHLVAELGFHRLAAGVMGEGPAGIAHRADVDECHLERFAGGGGRRGGRACRLGRLVGLFLAAAGQGQYGGGGQGCQGGPA